MLESADTLVSADYALRNRKSLSLEQLNDRAKQEKSKRKSREKFESREHEKADFDLSNELSLLDISTNEAEEKYSKREDIEINRELSIADQVKNYTESIRQGKSQTEILHLLITKFENNNAVSKWVENWRDFLKLHRFAETKPPQERKAIKRIISKADFSDETSFSTSLAEISQSKEISQATKLEISREFGGAHIDSVDGMDFQLKQVKEHTKAIEREIDNKSREQEWLDSEIESLKTELDSLPLDSPKRQELEEKIEQKKEQLENTKDEINRLEKGKPKETAFVLREGFSAKMDPDGSRSIKIMSSDFSIKLPSNRWLFSDKKNIRTINLAFPFAILKEQNFAKFLFRPNLEDNAVPTVENRKMGSLILNSLGYSDSKILSQESIKQLKKDLSMLNLKNGKTAQENLIELGIFDVASQSLNINNFKNRLTSIRENRDITKN
ncbi:MAG: hypothetical protein GKR88_11405 [Flavobacteriaceae bacterium]|nr:MAG: hypothetical protein GKR88_11405 [Flavobacteriaceae bacterium]